MRQPTPTNLLDDIFDDEEFSQENLSGALVWLPLAKLYDNPFQTRQRYDDEHIQRLADNIWSLRDELPATHGLQQPPVARVVQSLDDGNFAAVERDAYVFPVALRRRARSDKHAVELHFGHNRLRAWKLLAAIDERYQRFPVLLAYADDRQMWRHAVAENAQRKDISPLEEALTMRQAMERFGLTQEQVGQPFGYAKTTVSNKLRLLGLPQTLLDLLAEGKISEKHARTLLRLAPAPHLYNEFETIRKPWLATASESELSRMIDEIIWKRKPLPPQPKTGYAQLGYGVSHEPVTRPHDPPEWPYDWQPPEGVGVGACIGCRFHAHFGGDPGARCSAATSNCYDAKTSAWRKEQAAAQAAALAAESESQPSGRDTDADADTPSTQPAPLTGAAAKQLGRQIKAATWGDRNGTATSGQFSQENSTAPAVITSTAEITWFSTESWRGAPAALLEKGHCSADRCECFTLAYNPDAADHHVRPDADKAPNLCIGCKSAARLRNRRTEMEHGDVQEHHKRLKEEDAEAERLLRGWLYRATAADIWHNEQFMRSFVVHNCDIEQRYKCTRDDLTTLQEKFFLGVARTRCGRSDGATRRWSLDSVRTWLAKLDAAIGRTTEAESGSEGEGETLTAADWQVMKPTPTAEPATAADDRPLPDWAADADRPHWESAWTPDDEATYQNVMATWDGNWRHLDIATAGILYPDISWRILARLIEACPNDVVRRDLERFLQAVPA